MPSKIKNSTLFIQQLTGITLILFSAAASAALLTPANYQTDLSGLVVAAASTSKPVSSHATKCNSCGQIESVREISANTQTQSAPAVGGVMGGEGNQIGMGGGAIAGNHIEKNAASDKNYEIVVRLDDGSARTIHETHTPMWRPGDRVNVNNGTIQLAP